jgi:hypothetical protein
VSALAPTQEMQWELMYALAPDDPGRSRVLIVDNRYLDGPVDLTGMLAAFAAVTRRHDALRLSFTAVGPDPAVVVRDDVEPPIEVLDLSAAPEAAQRARIDEIAFEENRRRFDPRGPLWHAWLVRLGPDLHLLNLSFSHVIADGAACDVFVRDLLTAYQAGANLSWDSAALTFEEISRLQSARFAPTPERVEYWRARLAPIPQNPAFVRAAPAGADLLARGRLRFEFSDASAAEIRRLAWKSATTPFVVVLAAYHLLLSLVCGKERTVIASGTLARPTRGEKRTLMQCVTDTYVCADAPEGAPLWDVVRSAHESMTTGVENLLTYKDIARAAQPGFDTARPWPDYNLCDGHFYSGASYGPGPQESTLSPRHAYIPGLPTQDRKTELLAGRLPPALYEPWEAWCGPSVAMGNPRNGGVLLFNDEVYPTSYMRQFLDTYLWLLETLVWSPETKVGDVREGYVRDLDALS